MTSFALTDRVLGSYPLSIATSLAIEGGLGHHPDHPLTTKPLLDYDVLWVNLKTLFRNLYQSVERTQVHSVSPHDFYDSLVAEVDQLERIIATETGSRMKVVFYVSDYAGMQSAYPRAILRGDVTELQIAYSQAMKNVLGPYVKQNKETVKFFSLKITEASDLKVLMLTHFPIDLFAKNMPKLGLIESHTGTVKQKHQWYTKYLNGKELPMIPFMEGFMQVFGDAEHFRPMGLGIRRALIELANEYKWNQVTTVAKIKYSLDTLKDHLLRDVIRSLL